MDQTEAPAGKFRFGPFEADARARELRRRGLRIKLRGKSFEILIALLERPGELVTREELERRLWPDGVFVEFENSLNSAVNRLRSVLREGAGKPKYVETVPRLGYRFIAPVHQIRTNRPRLAVLPFDNLSQEPEHDFFPDAVTDALITELGNVSALRVISRQSVLHLKGSRRTAPEIARELKVDAIVEGSVLRAADRIRTTAQLIQAEPEQHLWARAYECEMGDLLTTQGHIARAIAEAIQVALTSGEVARLCRPRPVDPEAHVAYLKGRHLMDRWTRESFEKALEYFRFAAPRGAGHAPAYAHMADCYALLGHWGHLPFREAHRRAKEAALKAIALDDALSTAHWVLGWVTWVHDWDLPTCEAEMLRAIQLNPSDERAHVAYSIFLVTTSEARALAVSEAKAGLDLGPLSQHSNAIMAWIYLFVDDYEPAVEQARKTLELYPDSLQAYWALGLAAACTSRYTEAIAALEKAVAISPDAISMAYLGCALARAGRAEAAQALLRDLLSRSEREHVAPRSFAFLYAALGEPDRAFEWLEKAYEVRDSGLFFLRAMPLYDPLRSDPRFERMLQRVGISTGGGSAKLARSQTA